MATASALGLLLRWFDKNCSAVCQDFGDALHNLGRVVAGSHNGIGAEFGCVLQHEIECFLPSFLAEIRQQRDVPADQRLKSSPDRAKDRTRAHHDSPDHPQRARHSKAIEFELRGDHVVTDHPTSAVSTRHRMKGPPVSPPPDPAERKL